MKSTIFSLLLIITTMAFSQNIIPLGAAITVNDIEKSSHWYQEIFDLEISEILNFPDYDSLQIYILRNDKTQIELLEKQTSFNIQELMPNYSVNDKPMVGLYKLTFEVDDIDLFYRDLQKFKAEVVVELVEDETTRKKYFIINDPDGNSIQFFDSQQKN